MLYNIENLNMKYTSSEGNEEIENGAVLVCCHKWEYAQLTKWLPNYTTDMLEMIKDWLAQDCYIAEGLYLKVWCD